MKDTIPVRSSFSTTIHTPIEKVDIPFKTCFPSHQAINARDFVFARYTPTGNHSKKD